MPQDSGINFVPFQSFLVRATNRNFFFFFFFFSFLDEFQNGKKENNSKGKGKEALFIFYLRCTYSLFWP